MRDEQTRAPVDLGPEAQKAWDRLIVPLVETGLDQEIDIEGVIEYCQEWGRLVKAIGELHEVGGPLQLRAEAPGADLLAEFIEASEAMATLTAMLADFFDLDLDGGPGGKVPSRKRIKKAVIMAPERAVIH